jgi:hypothetical protein
MLSASSFDTYKIVLLFMKNPYNSNKSYYVVNNDSGSYGQIFVEELSNEYKLKLYSREDALENLKKKLITEFYEIEDGFTEGIKKGQKP